MTVHAIERLTSPGTGKASPRPPILGRILVVFATVLVSSCSAGFLSSAPSASRIMTRSVAAPVPMTPFLPVPSTFLAPLGASRDDHELSEEVPMLLTQAAARDTPTGSSCPTKQEQVQALLRQLQQINTLFWDYTVNFFYVAISCLILLNVCGYGYSFSADQGLQVLPINEFIQERQWKEELNRRPSTSTAETAPPLSFTVASTASSPASAVFLQH
jgi:hypothetical protein